MGDAPGCRDAREAGACAGNSGGKVTLGKICVVVDEADVDEADENDARVEKIGDGFKGKDCAEAAPGKATISPNISPAKNPTSVIF